MPERDGPERALAHICRMLRDHGRAFALVGGLAVSVRAEVRFTRDVDIAVAVRDDSDAESLLFELTASGYRALATVEHDRHGRLATARLESPSGVVVDLMFASTGIEREIVERSTVVALERVGTIPVARVEELLAMKVLSMTEQRLKDRIDAGNLIAFNPEIDIAEVRRNLDLIAQRGYDRKQDLGEKLEQILRANSAS